MMDNEKASSAEMFNLGQQLSGDFGQPISQLRRVESGTDSKVYSARFDDQDVFLKMNDDEALFAMHQQLFDLLAGQRMPVPTILDFRQQTSLGKPVIMEAKVPGVPMDQRDGPEKAELLYQAGKLFRRIHEITLPGYGWLEKDGGALRGGRASWGEYLADEKSEVGDYLLENGLIDADEQQALMRLWDELSSTSISQGVLLHGDFQEAHLFTNENSITGVIDWGGARVGDPRYDLAASSMFIEGKEWEQLKQGYGEGSNDPLVEVYGTMIAARKLKLRHAAKRSEARINNALNRLKSGLNVYR